MRKLLVGDCRELLPELPEECVQTVVTSPPYWQLVDYGHAQQLGQEPELSEYVAQLVAVFGQVRRVLRADGTVWLNIGDTYASAWPCRRKNRVGALSLENGRREKRPARLPAGLKEKDLCGVPWRVALALQADGWYLRCEVIWSKLRAVPDGARDRPCRSHESLFLFSRSRRYYYRRQQGERSVWELESGFPESLVERCIQRTSVRGDTVLDPFAGRGTVAAVAKRMGRRAVGIDLRA